MAPKNPSPVETAFGRSQSSPGIFFGTKESDTMDKDERQKPDKLKVCVAPIEIKEDNGNRVIKGYASTPAVDSYDEIVIPTAFNTYLPKYQEYPILLVNHQWYEIPIGQFDLAKVDEKGLYVEASISKTAMGNDVWTLIKDGVLKAFSIGYRVHKSEYDDDTKITTLTEVELVEISIVNVPANREALFQAAKSRGLKSIEFKTSEQPNKKGGAEMDPVEIEQKVKDAVDAKTIGMAAQATEAVNATLTPKLKDVEGKFMALVTEAKDAAKGCVTQAEKAELIAKLTKLEEDQHLIETRQKQVLAGQKTEFVNLDAPIEDIAIKHPYGPVYGAALSLPDELLGKDKDAIKEWRVAHDDIALLNTILGTSRSYRGPQSLKSFGRYHDLTEKIFAKAMSATTSSYGDEWVPTDMSAELTALIELNAVVANQFPVVSMPSNPWDLPYQSGHITVYSYDEPVVDFATEISRSTPTTGKNTLTAKGIAAATVVSKDATEDSLIPMLPIIRNDLAYEIARQFDNAYINGDTTATHRDTGLTIGANDIRRLYDGLRHQANADSKEYNCQTVKTPNSADWEAADLMMMRKQMGACGTPERAGDLAIVLSLDNFYEAWLWDEVKTVDKLGASATVITGDLPRIWGIPIYTSSFILTTYPATGIYTAAGTTSLALMFNRRGWVSGSRRAVTIETEANIKTQQTIVVATARRAFAQIRAVSTEYNCVAGINIPVL